MSSNIALRSQIVKGFLREGEIFLGEGKTGLLPRRADTAAQCRYLLPTRRPEASLVALLFFPDAPREIGARKASRISHDGFSVKVT